MNKLFIDTNAFHKIGYNFDQKNLIISTLLKNIKDGKYKYYNLSVIDNEIISHLKQRGKNNENEIKKIKWLKNYLSKEEIENNCYKDLKDYVEFKKKANAIDCGISEINPENIFNKYFKSEYPFENKKDKKSEFPDAFIAEYVNNMNIKNNDIIYFITDDIGLNKALNEKILVYEDLPSFLSETNNIDPYKFKEIEKYLKENIDTIQQNIFKKMNLQYSGLEEEKINVNKVKIQNIIDVKVIKSEKKRYYISCTCDFLILSGEFICLDYYRSYRQTDVDNAYFDPVYILLNELPIDYYEFLICVEEKDGKYILRFLKKYDIRFNYKDMEKADIDNIIAENEDYNHYNGEDFWK
ncbi:MAG: DUF4935 domain-containing protein [Bacilli bacterium]|nr:DUF4935 domain-containing protein [Bacilli bacterium]